jgi:hypothetical protein
MIKCYNNFSKNKTRHDNEESQNRSNLWREIGGTRRVADVGEIGLGEPGPGQV